MSEFPINTRGLRKSFDDKQVLAGVNLEIPVGAVVGLIGTNGTGK